MLHRRIPLNDTRGKPQAAQTVINLIPSLVKVAHRRIDGMVLSRTYSFQPTNRTIPPERARASKNATEHYQLDFTKSR
jgi:hypothetical protein